MKRPFIWRRPVKAICPDGVALCGRDGKEFDVACDSTVVSIGYVPIPLAAASKHVHIVGDANAVGNLRTVIWRAWDVCIKI